MSSPRSHVSALLLTSACCLLVPLGWPSRGLRHAPDFTPADFARPAGVPSPASNRATPERVALGKALFFDPRLSASRTMSCATCHIPSFAWGDGRERAVGDHGRELARRTPTILNVAWAQALFWDGSSETLEEQALKAIESAGVMNLPLDELVRRVRAMPGYRAMFSSAYPSESIGTATIAKALAAYQRTIVSADAPFDRWVRGDSTALSAEARLGFRVFTGKGNCAACHSSWRFTDDSFHDIGVPTADSGRGRLLPDIEGAAFAFKTPTLRNVAERRPYMHDGSEATLADVVELYDRDGRVQRPSLSPEIRPLRLTTAEKRALVAFLVSLSSRDPDVTFPTLPH